MQKAIGCAIVVLLVAGNLWAQLSHGDRVVTVVNTPEVNVRSRPDVNPESLMGKILRGTQMKLIKKQGAWYQVLLPDGREAFVHSKYAEEGVARDLLEVSTKTANVRRNPSTAADKMASVKRGDMLSLVRERNNWYFAILPDGRRGWIYKDLVILRPVRPPSAPSPPPRARPDAAPEPAEVPSPVRELAKKVDFYQSGMDNVSEGRIEEAIDAFRKALEANPDDGAAHFELAKLLKGKGERDGALAHFRKALKGDRPRVEAKFHIEGLLKAPADSSESGEAMDVLDEVSQEGWVDGLLGNATYILPGLAAGSLIFLIVLGLVYRRRRGLKAEGPAYRRRKPDAGFDAVLKYAVEKRPLLRAIEEAERKRTDLDEALGQRFDAFHKAPQEGGPRLPSVESSEALLKKVDELRQTILSQEERAQIYADLVVLQNEKLDALDEEIEALKKLIQIDYRDARKGRQGRGPGEGGKSPS